MKSILQFLYLGQATFYQDRMNEFLNVAKSLEIKEISEDVECDDVDILRGKENDENVQVHNEIIKTDTQARGYKEKSVQYQCDKCEK